MSTVNETSTPSEKKINGQDANGVTEIVIPVPWGQISGKWWGPMDQQPIVAIHGWQDNAGTFDALIPLLPSNEALLAIDLPGHGFSSHYPNGQFYYIFWDGLFTLRRVFKYYKWNKVKLLGHSLGGAISFLYAASYPDEVDFVISLDIAGPNVKDIEKSSAQTGDIIDKFLKYEHMQSNSIPAYPYETILDIAEGAYGGSITREGAVILMKRGIKQSPNSEMFQFSRDPRLKVSGLGMFSMDLVLSYAGRIKCGYLNIRAVPGMKFDHPEVYEQTLDKIKQSAKKFEYHKVEGTHHVHLINPERIAPIINNFISST